MQSSGGPAAYIGLDIGSTTVKLVILNQSLHIRFARYQRHMSNVRSTVAMLFSEALGSGSIPEGTMTMSVTGSGAIALSRELGIPFVQEVIASSASIRRFHPDIDVAIELGGEDAKITFFTGGTEQRMNETCAGGTGAFIDQMAAFLRTDAAGLNALAANATTIYPIASRCGVFAKSDVLPLLNEGCAREDIAVSIFQ
ncbi:MAG: 2-hydroxyglutaryl-CoA dehydratase, partial [Mailhella sp.]|nr:2-hydroxyglutaryl-CoA dehydratase [Mailhella sp.]